MEQRDGTPGDRQTTRPMGGVFQREGEYWTLAYGGTTSRLRDAAGLRHLAHLLARPGQKVAAPALIETARRCATTPPAGPPAAGTAAAVVTQRARARVTCAIRAAMVRIAAHHPPLGEHLAATIKTGAYCSYAPDPRIAPAWTL